MPYPHRIRLRGPWECEPLARAGGENPLPAPQRMALPCRWGEGGLAGFAGRVRFVRRFGYPGHIDPFERVWLTFAAVEGAAEVSLNGRFLGHHDGAAGPFEYEVTPLLQPRNHLVVDVEGLTDRGGLWGEVTLEVRRTAFLRGVRACVDRDAGRLVIEGQVVGTAERPLDLYVLRGRSTAAYTTVEAAPDGRSFTVVVDPAQGAPQESGGAALCVELVDAAVVWYAVTVPPPAV